jgi:preprotein translocase subunit SecA
VDRGDHPAGPAQRPERGLRSRFRRLLQKPGSASLAPFQGLLAEIAAQEAELAACSDEELTALALASDDAVGDATDARICALGREAARRALGERPFDVQLLGTLALLSGRIAEMATGEGKTLAGALAAAGYARRGHRVHVMSVNDYLARRDAEWMAPVYALLGVSVGWIGQASTPAQRRAAYAADVCYAPASEIGFDLLRDRLATRVADLICGEPDVVLIDEADSVLVDEALVPLVLAGTTGDADPGHEMAAVAARLLPGLHYEVDDEGRNVFLTDAGAKAAEQALGGINLYDEPSLETLTRLNVALHARALLRRDVDYIVTAGQIQLVSAARGRVASLQRWPDGLQAAVEAKEGLSSSRNGEVLDSITIQSLVRRYPVVCGMTGTAVAVGEQLREFYQLEIVVIPLNRPCVRDDEPDRLYRTEPEKQEAIAREVAATHATGRPVLIGTLDVAESEQLAARLGRDGLSCVVLNARNDAQEAAIVAEAGAYGAITVSTQMAGRGTDIRLGGAAGDRDRVAELGGLFVLGTGRHASSRLDDQLRGRSGRQGDPGGSAFFLSLQDELITSYAPDAELPGAADADRDGALTDAGSHWTVGHAQRVAEGVHLQVHRDTWRYNVLLDDQRAAVLRHRDQVLRTDAALAELTRSVPDRVAELADIVPAEVLADAARQLSLAHLDRAWTEHLARAADLREGIHLRALGRGSLGGSGSPVDEFNRELAKRFSRFLEDANERTAAAFAAAEITADGIDLAAPELQRPSATWTYLVQENPFGTDLGQAVQAIGRLLRRR